jgi:hypothetical protein
MNFRCVLLTASSLALAGLCSAADPGQVGTWAGSLKTKVYAPSGVTSRKQTLQLEIAADDTTTLTLGGSVVPSAPIAFIPGEAAFVYSDTSVAPNNNIVYAVGHFKGTKLKGATSGITVDGSSALLETLSGKFSLKKQ